MHQTLTLRSDRVIALFRLTLAAVLLGTFWLDPNDLISSSFAGTALLFGYLAFAIGALTIAWSDWWRAHRLRLLAFCVDLAAAFLVLYLIESSGSGVASPFLAFFVYLIVTGILIWRVRTMLWIALAILAAYAAVGLALSGNGMMPNPAWFMRRMVFMVVLAGLIAWFGHSRNFRQPDRLDWPFDAPIADRFEVVVRFVQNHMKASGVAVFWSPDDEPWIYLGVDGIAGQKSQRLSPDKLDLTAIAHCDAILFDRLRNRSLHLLAGDRILAQRGSVDLAPAEYLGVAAGILVPLTSETGQGFIVLTGIKGVTADHLKPARALGEEIGHAVDRHALAEISQTAQLTNLRLSMARDLHDSIAQSLAGASFRLEALSQKHRAGNDIAADLESLQTALAREQESVQGMIHRLRSGEAPGPDSNLLSAFKLITADAERRWGVRCALDCKTPNTSIPTVLVRQVERLVNEGVANAVRHSHARKVDVIVERQSGHLSLIIANARAGADRTPFIPLSIAERVESLGGSLAISNDGDQTFLRIALPMKALP